MYQAGAGETCDCLKNNQKQSKRIKEMRGGKRQGSGRKPGKISKIKLEMRDLAREFGPESIDTLAQIMRDTSAPHAARVSAADKILDRGYGKPPQDVAVSGGITVRMDSDDAAA